MAIGNFGFRSIAAGYKSLLQRPTKPIETRSLLLRHVNNHFYHENLLIEILKFIAQNVS